MLISLGKDNSTFEPVEVTKETLPDLILNHTWSPAVYKNNHRTNENFIQAHTIALDFDGGFSIEQAKNAFKEYEYIIGTTRSHQKEKNGVVDDRYRVLLFLTEPITDPKVYTATIADLLSSYPGADRACKDPARMFYSCTLIYDHNTGKRIAPNYNVKEAKLPKIDLKGKGRLGKNTIDFLFFGTDIDWNHRLYAATKDIQQQGYTKEEAYDLLTIATRNYQGSLDTNDKKTIESAYKEPASHEKRDFSAFEFKSLKELFTKKPKISWLVDGLLSVGGVSIIAGQPKSGKSTIIRQLTASVAGGTHFLGREVAKGSVVYLALEEQDAMVYNQFKALGVTEDMPITYHIGPINSVNGSSGFEEFSDYLLSARPKFAVIDTLVMFARIKDQNNYQEVYEAISSLRALARQSGTHIMCIHHTRKPFGNDRGTATVMGSGAFTGAVDSIIYFENVESRRYISTQGRGTKDFRSKPLVFDEKTQTYILGVDDGF